MTRLGIISDTHGYWRETIRDHFRGVDVILHAGDVGDPKICDHLREIAPTYAVRGNVDDHLPLDQFPHSRVLDFDGVVTLLVHTPEDATAQVTGAPGLYKLVIHGHTHRPRKEKVGDCLWFNPGAAGRARFGRDPDVGVGLVEIRAARIVASRFVPLCRLSRPAP